MKLSRKLILMGGGPFDYYVDSVGGLDTNTGTSKVQAWQTIAKLGTIAAGTRIGLARGSTWREQMTIAATSVQVKAYGTGTVPLIDCSDILVNATFSKTAGQTNVYEYVAATNYVNEESWINVWEAGAFLANVASLALCDSTAGSYYVASHLTATPTIYIHPNGSTDPTADGKVYEFSARSYGIAGRTANYLTINGIRTRRNYNTSGSIVTGTSATLISCQASQGNKHNIYIQPGSNLTACTADEAYYPVAGGSTLFILNQGVGDDSGVIYNNCIASLTTYSATIQGFSAHVNTSGTLGTITYNTCTVTNCGQGFSTLSGTTVVNYNNCVLTGCSRGWTITNGTTHNITGGTYTYTTLANLLLNTTTAVAINIDGLTATYDSSHATGLIQINVDLTNLRITNSTFIDNIASATGYFILSIEDIVFYSHNNNFRSPNLTTAGIFVYRLIGTGTTYDSDYNTYSKNSFYYSLASGTSHLTLAAFQTALSQDLNSTVG